MWREYKSINNPMFQSIFTSEAYVCGFAHIVLLRFRTFLFWQVSFTNNATVTFSNQPDNKSMSYLTPYLFFEPCRRTACEYIEERKANRKARVHDQKLQRGQTRQPLSDQTEKRKKKQTELIADWNEKEPAKPHDSNPNDHEEQMLSEAKSLQLPIT
jgi:hypothetical protein